MSSEIKGILQVRSISNASTRARAQMEGLGLVSSREAEGVRKVLSAAAMTYVAAAIAAVMQLLYYLMLLSGRSED